MHTQKSKGIALLVTSSFFFALMSVFVRLSGDLPFFQKVLFRNAVSMVVAGSVLWARRIPVQVPQGCGVPLAARIACGTIGVFCNYYAIDHLLLASSNSLSKLSPFFAILFAALFLKERLSRVQLGCIALALVGSLFLIVPNLGTLGFASSVALLGGVASGGAHVALRSLGRSGGMHGTVVVFCFSAVSTLTVLVPCLLFWTPMTLLQILWLLLAGSSCAAAQFALTNAYRFAPPKDISIYDSSQILFSGLFGYLFFQQIPGLTSWIAYLFILAASALLFLYYVYGGRGPA
jgi:drug/metabolite transporter (DMT)-like permease